MNPFAKLQTRAQQGRRLRTGLVGAGKFGSMCLSQVPRPPVSIGLPHIVIVIDATCKPAVGPGPARQQDGRMSIATQHRRPCAAGERWRLRSQAASLLQ